MNPILEQSITRILPLYLALLSSGCTSEITPPFRPAGLQVGGCYCPRYRAVNDTCFLDQRKITQVDPVNRTASYLERGLEWAETFEEFSRYVQQKCEE